MIKKLLFLFSISLLFASPFYANNTIDSLENRLVNVVGSERTLTLKKLTQAYILVNPKKALEYAEETYSSAVRSNMISEKHYSILLKSKDYYHLNNYPKALVEANKAKKLFEQDKLKEYQAEAITMLGHIHLKKGEFEQAIELYQDAITLQKHLGSKVLYTQSILNMGVAYQRLANNEKALQLYLKALELADKKDNTELKANALNHVAGIYWKLGHNKKALRNYLKSLELREKQGDLLKIAKSLSNIGVVYKDMSDFEQALAYHLKALAIKTELGNENDIAYSLILVGNVFLNLNKLDESLQYYNKALQIKTKLDDKVGVANALDNIALVYKRKNKNVQAINAFKESLKVREKLGNKRLISKSLNNLGGVYWKLDKYHRALEYFIQALEILHGVGDQLSMAKSLNNVGLIYKELSNYNLAVNYHEKALSVYQKIGNEIQTAVTLNYLGNVFWKTKDYTKALDKYMQALRIRKEIGNQSAIASSLNNIGLIYRDMNDLQKSIDFYTNALEKYKTIGDNRGYASVLNNLGDVYAYFNDKQQAINYYNQSLKVKSNIDDKRGTAVTSLNMAQLYMAGKNYNMALPFLNKAMQNAKLVGEAELLKSIAYESFILHQKTGNKSKALSNYMLYTEQKDSILNRENSKKIAELQIRFEMNRKENEIASLKRQKEIDDIRIKYQRRLVMVLIVCFLLAMYAAVQFYLRLKNKKQANSMLERIFSIIAHDLREPVSSLTNMSYLLTKKSNEVNKDEQNKIASHIGRLSDSLLSLLDNLLNWTRTEQGLVNAIPEPICIKQLVSDNQSILVAMANEKNIKIKNEVAESIQAYADKNGISLVIRNLLSNALKFSLNNNEIRVFAYQEDKNIVVGIEDYGRGIPKKKLDSIFANTANESELGTNNEKGTGIGLKLCANFIKVNKGRIWAESIENKHTVFYFSLPTM